MSFLSFLGSLRHLAHQLSRVPGHGRPASRKRAATSRPRLEFLEDRTLPATITWTGSADNSNWHTPANWDLGRLPGAVANDDVVIPDRAATALITYSTGSTAIRSLVSQEALVLSGGSLSIGLSGAVSTINGSFTVSGGSLEFKSTTLNGPGTLTNTATLTLTGSIVSAPLDNRGTLVAQVTSALNGSLATAANSILRVLGSNAGDAALTVANGFTNSGAIELTSVDASKSATLTVTSGTLTNAATASLRALAGTGGIRTLRALLVNQGTLSVAANLTVDNTGRTFTNSGTIDSASGRTLTVSGGTFTPQAGTMTGLGSVTVSGATANLTTAFSYAVTTLTLFSVTVTGPGTLTNAPGKTLRLTGSTVNAPLVNQGTLVARRSNQLNGSLTTAPSSLIDVEGDSNDLLFGNATLTVADSFTNNGTIELSETSGRLAHRVELVVRTGTLTNAPGATLSVRPTPPSGLLSPIPDQGTRALNAQLDNWGTLRAATSLTVGSTGRTFSNSGTIDIARGHTLSTAAAVSNAGTVDIDAGSTFTASSTYSQTAGTLTGAGTLTVTGRLTWSGGTMSGSGQTRANGGLDLRGAADKVLTQRTFTNAGSATWTETGNFVVGGGATFINQAGATFDIQNDAILGYGSGAAPTFTNAGTFRKSAGTGTTTLGGSVTFTNTGTVEVRTGTLFLQGPFTNFADTTLTDGTYLVSGTLKFAGADLGTNAATVVLDGPNSRIVNHAEGNGLANFATNTAAGRFTLQNGRNFTTAAAVAFTNAGTLTVGAGSTFTVAGTFTNFASATLTGGTYVVSGTLKFNGADLGTNAANLVLDGTASQIVNQTDGNGLANFATNAAAGRFTLQNGRNFTTAAAVAFTNAGTLSVGTGSTFTVAGTFTNFASATLTGGTYVLGGTLKFNGDLGTNAATLVLDGTASQIVNQANANALTNFATNTAAGRFTLQNGRTFTTAAAVAFTNAGTLSVGAGSTFTVAGNFTNFASATLTGGTYVLGGTLKFNGADLGTNAATLVLDGPNSQIVNQTEGNGLANFATNAAAGHFTIQNGRNFSVAGPFSNAGTMTLGAGSTFTASSIYSQTAGTLTGAGTLTVTGRLTWTGGTMSGSGQTRANGGLDLRGAADKVLTQRTLSNAGSATWTDAGNFVVGGGATFTNQAGATFDIQNDAILGYGSGIAPTVTNAGTFRKSAGSGTTTLGGSVTFTNTGTVEVRTGTLFLQGPFTNFQDATLTDGTYLITGTLKFAGADIATNAATVVLDGPNSRIVNHAEGNGLANFATNATAGRFTVQNGRTFTTAGAFTNAGSVTVVGTASTFAAAGAFTNANSVTIGSGSTFTVTGRYTQTEGSTTLNGGTLSAGTVDIQRDILAGSGTINANLENAGQVNPGGTGAAGVLTVNGNYTQSASGTLNIEIGGLNAGSQHDRLSVSGSATLGGTLNIRLINSFLPSIDNSFQVLLFGSRSGDFATITGRDLTSDRILELSFEPTSTPVRLTLVTKRKA